MFLYALRYLKKKILLFSLFGPGHKVTCFCAYGFMVVFDGKGWWSSYVIKRKNKCFIFFWKVPGALFWCQSALFLRQVNKYSIDIWRNCAPICYAFTGAVPRESGSAPDGSPGQKTACGISSARLPLSLLCLLFGYGNVSRSTPGLFYLWKDVALFCSSGRRQVFCPGVHLCSFLCQVINTQR